MKHDYIKIHKSQQKAMREQSNEDTGAIYASHLRELKSTSPLSLFCGAVEHD
jgi:hypothetical protein